MAERNGSIDMAFQAAAYASGYNVELLALGKHGTSSVPAWRQATMTVCVTVLEVPPVQLARYMNRAPSSVTASVREWRYSIDPPATGPPEWRQAWEVHPLHTARRGLFQSVLDAMIDDPLPHLTLGP